MKTLFIKLAISLPLIGISALANASDWRIISDDMESTYYIDINSLANVEGYRKVWVSYVSKNGIFSETYANKLIGNRKSLFFYDCKTAKVGVAQFVLYEFKSDAIIDNKTFKNWKYLLDDIVPDSIGEEIFNIICKGKSIR